MRVVCPRVQIVGATSLLQRSDTAQLAWCGEFQWQQWHFQRLSRTLHGLLKFYAIRMELARPSQPSSIVVAALRIFRKVQHPFRFESRSTSRANSWSPTGPGVASNFFHLTHWIADLSVVGPRPWGRHTEDSGGERASETLGHAKTTDDAEVLARQIAGRQDAIEDCNKDQLSNIDARTEAVEKFHLRP